MASCLSRKAGVVVHSPASRAGSQAAATRRPCRGMAARTGAARRMAAICRSSHGSVTVLKSNMPKWHGNMRTDSRRAAELHRLVEGEIAEDAGGGPLGVAAVDRQDAPRRPPWRRSGSASPG